ncbi:hypothetical protein [Leifsonia virtsii]|uniref:Uncharacterized protein n=1 Tax=Leifsonia virtsii TaxID=3035915 RepID=A0ABT8ISW5_9MICO|nr:hypothetical protein [Leifsonia virtsii]MDN4595896.1 hypothetical protein [Leifsonia virtsii]
MEVGERWVYHPTKFDAVHCAEVLKIGKTVTVKIHESWLKGKLKVKREQLHVPWDQRDEYLARVKPFMDLSDHPGPEEDEWNAAEIVFVATGLNNHIDFHGYGCAETYDAPTVLRACRIGLNTLSKAPGTVVDGDHIAFPWETTLVLAKRLAYTRYETVLDYVRHEEDFWVHRARDNTTYPYSGIDEDEYEELVTSYVEWFKPGFDKVKEWAGVQRASQREQLHELRAKYDRLLPLARSAAAGLSRTRANVELADKIEANAAAPARHQNPFRT